jgi:hypothetical protein
MLKGVLECEVSAREVIGRLGGVLECEVSARQLIGRPGGVLECEVSARPFSASCISTTAVMYFTFATEYTLF